MTLRDERNEGARQHPASSIAPPILVLMHQLEGRAFVAEGRLNQEPVIEEPIRSGIEVGLAKIANVLPELSACKAEHPTRMPKLGDNIFL